MYTGNRTSYPLLVLAALLAFVCGCAESSKPSTAKSTPAAPAAADTAADTAAPASEPAAPAAPSEPSAPAPSEPAAPAPSEPAPSEPAPSEPAPSEPSAPPPAEAAPAVTIEPATGPWGHLHGRFVYDGSPPPQQPLQVTKDVEFCGQHVVLDETLVVNPDNRGVANLVVSLYLGRNDKPPQAHESYAATAEGQVTLDNDKCRFHPHVLTLRTTQTLVIRNLDAVGHNTKIDTFNNPGINPITPAGGSTEQQFSLAESRPAPGSCSIHPWMGCWVIVKDHPYIAVTDAEGAFVIKNLPAGEWTFQAWHEKARNVTEVSVGGKKQDWARGRFTVDIKPGQTVDLGEVKVAANLFSGE